MTGRDAYLNACYAMTGLIRDLINGSVPAPETVQALDMQELYEAADRHMLVVAVAMALEKAGIRDPKFIQGLAKALRKSALMDAEMCAVLKRLDEAGIWHMPLKGAVIERDYPRFGMRQMTDRDILIDARRAGDVRDVMTELGFKVTQYGKGADDVYHKPPVSCFEMHRALFAVVHDGRLYAYYKNIEQRLIPEGDGSFGRHFSPEDFYIYLTAHAFKHYDHAGTGLRSLLDAYVYWNAHGAEMDLDYVGAELKKLGIDEFEREFRGLAMDLFGNASLSEKERAMLDDVLLAGVFGNAERGAARGAENAGGRLKYLLKNIFLPMDRIQSSFPFFYKHKILLPLLPFYWFGYALRHHRGRVSAELRALLKKPER